MTTVVISENSAQAYSLIEYIKTLPFARIVESDELDNIPGLPYTHEERMEALRQADEDIVAGRVFTERDVRAMFAV